MIITRVWQRRTWSSGRRLMLLHSSPTPPPPQATAYVTHAPPSRALFNASATSATSYKFQCSLRRSYCTSESLAAHHPVEGIVDVPLAQTGEGIAECELLKWFVQEGDQVEEFQPLCEVQSDKATIEITSRYRGKVEQVLHVPGDIVKVGEMLLKMVVEGSHIPATVSDVLEKVKLEASDHSKNTEPLASETSKSNGVLSTPTVRSLAKQYGIDVNEVTGTGVNGRVLKEDVLGYAAKKGIIEDASTTVSATPAEQLKRSEEGLGASAKHDWHYGDKTLPLRGYQRAMVKTMSMAAKVPHFYYVDEINCDALVDLKTSFQSNNTDTEIKHTFLPTLVKSLSIALSKYPLMNSCFNDETLEVILKGLKT